MPTLRAVAVYQLVVVRAAFLGAAPGEEDHLLGRVQAEVEPEASAGPAAGPQRPHVLGQAARLGLAERHAAGVVARAGVARHRVAGWLRTSLRVGRTGLVGARSAYASSRTPSSDCRPPRDR